VCDNNTSSSMEEDFIFFCEECDVLICRVCTTKTHKKHDITDIKDSVKELESKIPKYLNSKVDNFVVCPDKSVAVYVPPSTNLYILYLPVLKTAVQCFLFLLGL
jgi:hypothetical protein